MDDRNGVLVDTSFLIRLTTSDSKFNENANKYYKYFMDKNISIFVSTISLAEYCVKGKLTELPLRNGLRIVSFDAFHAEKAGEFANFLFEQKNSNKLKVSERSIIPNDVKIYAQCELEKNISHCISRDLDFKKIHSALKSNNKTNLKLIDLDNSYEEEFGLLKL